MKFSNRENKCLDVEGHQIWHSRSVAVVGMVIFLHKGEQYVLMGKRGRGLPNEVGKWCMPCGYLDWDETCEDAVIREVWEETGVNLNKAMHNYDVLCNHMHYPWRINSDPSPPLQNVSMHYAVYMKTESMIEGEISRLPDVSTINNNEDAEVEEVRWIKLQDVSQYECAFNHDSIIKIFVNNLEPVKDELY